MIPRSVSMSLRVALWSSCPDAPVSLRRVKTRAYCSVAVLMMALTFSVVGIIGTVSFSWYFGSFHSIPLT